MTNEPDYYTNPWDHYDQDGNSLDRTSWSVTVERNGEMIVTIETALLCGRDLLPGDEDAIRTAAHHLLAFIGDPPPPENRSQQIG